MADNINELVALMAADGVVVTREEAERLAIRVSGSVEEYIAEQLRLSASVADAENIPPPEGDSDKFGAPLAYDVEPLGDSAGVTCSAQAGAVLASKT